MDENEVRKVAGRTFELEETNRRYGGWGDDYVDVYEVTSDGQRRGLTDRIDPVELEILTDEVLLALTEPRRVGLMGLMGDNQIVAGPDYQYEDVYDLLYSTAPVGRYVAVSGDETYHWIHVVETIEQGLESFEADIADQVGNEYPHHPEELRDLDTGKSIGFLVKVTVERAG